MSVTEHRRDRRVRSFVRREGRLTRGQARALEALWPRYGIDADRGELDLDALFGRRAPRALEIGFGNGEALIELASHHRDWDFIGVEVYRPGVGRLLIELEDRQLDNVRVICRDAVEALAEQIPAASLDAVYVFFPDPWPKKRHHKRRLIQPDFIERLATRLRPGARVHLATDWEDYAQQMLEVMESAPGFLNVEGAHRFAPRPETRPPTRFERRGQARGHPEWDLAFTYAPGADT